MGYSYDTGWTKFIRSLNWRQGAEVNGMKIDELRCEIRRCLRELHHLRKDENHEESASAGATPTSTCRPAWIIHGAAGCSALKVCLYVLGAAVEGGVTFIFNGVGLIRSNGEWKGGLWLVGQPLGEGFILTPLWSLGALKSNLGRTESDSVGLRPARSGNKGRWRAESLTIKMFQSGTCVWWHISLTRTHFTLYQVFPKLGPGARQGF